MNFVNAVPEPMILPTIFNDALIVVALFNVVFPETFNDDMHDVALFIFVVPDMFKFAVTFTPDIFINQYCVALIGSS